MVGEALGRGLTWGPRVPHSAAHWERVRTRQARAGSAGPRWAELWSPLVSLAHTHPPGFSPERAVHVPWRAARRGKPDFLSRCKSCQRGSRGAGARAWAFGVEDAPGLSPRGDLAAVGLGPGQGAPGSRLGPGGVASAAGLLIRVLPYLSSGPAPSASKHVCKCLRGGDEQMAPAGGGSGRVNGPDNHVSGGARRPRSQTGLLAVTRPGTLGGSAGGWSRESFSLSLRT